MQVPIRRWQSARRHDVVASRWKAQMNVQSTNTILRLKQVKEITGLSRSTIYLYMKERKFPKQRELGGERAVGWHSGSVFQWVAERQVAR